MIIIRPRLIWEVCMHFGWSCRRSNKLKVGRLGVHHLSAGHYIYFGSALGSGGIAARVHRHLRTVKRRFWHIDHLSGFSRVHVVFFCITRTRLECIWSQHLLEEKLAIVPIRGFGSSDCSSGCGAHFQKFDGTIPM